MTERAYYTDSYGTTFDAVVTRAFTREDRPAVTLDRTLFYPTSGGQPHDVGTLGGARVLEVVELDEGAVAHVLDAELPVGARVSGSIDWHRRFDHMQQHTGQHVLSAAFDRLFDNRTVSFHMSADASTIDLARAAGPEQIAAAEAEANRVVWEDRPVTVRFVTGEEAAALPLRKEPVRTGTLRLVEVADYDLSACGGTHVARTGAIGLIAATASERIRGGTRVAFVCGGRALRAFAAYRDAIAGSVRSLSVTPAELPAAVDRVQAESKELRKVVRTLQEALAAHEAARFVAEAPLVGGLRLVVRAVEGWDAAGLKTLAAASAAHGSVAAALLSSTTPALAVVARSEDAAVDAAAVLRDLVRQFGGRGGGRPELAQGGGLSADVERLLEAARIAIEQQLRS